MDEKTTTEAPVESGVEAPAETQPVETAPAEAVETTETQEQQEAPEPSTEDNSTADWLKAKGIDPTSPEAIEKVAEMARNAEKAMHQKAQKASELEKAVEGSINEEAEATGFTDQNAIDLAKIKIKMGIRDFFDSNPEAKKYEQAMVAELAKRPHLAGDLDSLYAVAVVNSGKLDEVKSQGGREALETLAHKQQATTPAGNATNGSVFTSQTITPQNVNELVAKNDQAWFEKNYDQINRALAG